MTQPPNQQPPQGGSGAPQDQPPQGGFGAPQMPSQPPQGPPAQPPQAPQPGYGYPQQPPQPGPYAQPSGPYGAPAAPAAPGPYGQPPQPGPYGQPPQPGPYGQQAGSYGQQPGYGFPPPQFPGAPGTPQPGSRNPFRGKPALAVGAAVAALLVIGGTVFAVTSGDDGGGEKKPVAGPSDDGKPSASDAPVNPGDGSGDGGEDPEDFNADRKTGEAKVLWYKEAPDAPASGADAPGMWITSTTAVKAAYKEVVGYGVGDGKPAWDTITLPQKICAVTPRKTAADKVVVAYMNGSSDRAKCNQLQQIDLKTGAKGWTGTVPDGALFDSAITIELSVAGNTLMVGRSQSGTAYDVNTGKKLWEKKKYGDACFPTAFAGGAKLISVASCDATKAGEHDELQELDPATGKVKWTQKFDKGWKVARAYSLDPLVVYSTNKDKNAWNISTLKPDGTFRSQVGVDEDFAPECGWAILQRNLTGCKGTAADANTLYLPTKATTGANEIVAIDLATGKEKWRVKSPTDESMLPVTVEGGNLVAYVEPSYAAAGRVVSIPTAGATHTPSTLLQMPESTSRLENSFFSRDLAWVDGRFYLSTTRLAGSDDSKEKLMLAYGK